MKTPYKILLWDMDGTLTDSQEGLIASLRYAFDQYGLPPETDDTIRSFLGPSLKHTFLAHYGFSEEKADEAVLVFRKWFHANGMLQGNHVYDGIIDLLKDLKAAGYRMAIATSKLEQFAVEIADYFGLTPYFEVVCGSDQEGKRLEKAAVITWALRHFEGTPRNEILMIGDREMDVKGAAQNGLDAVAVLYGYGSPEEVAAARFQCKSVEDLRQLLL